MGSIFVRMILALLGFITVLAIIGSLLPRQFDVESEIRIAAPPAVVFDQVNDLRQWPSWSNWSPARIPDLEIQLGDKTVGEGASQQWTDVRGQGKIWFTSSQPNERIRYEMEFRTFSEMRSQFDFEPDGEGTRVRWSSRGALPGGPFYGYFAFLFESGMRQEYLASLERLKQVAEQASTEPGNASRAGGTGTKPAQSAPSTPAGSKGGSADGSKGAPSDSAGAGTR